MSGFCELMQKVAEAENKRRTHTALLYGTVAGVSPLVITIDDKFPVYEGQITLSALCKPFVTTAFKHLHKDSVPGDTDERLLTVEVWRGLQAGDRVRLLQCNGGQQYYVLDREVFP